MREDKKMTINIETMKTSTENTTEMTIVTGITTQVVNIPQGDEISWKLFREGTSEVVYGVKIENTEGEPSWLGIAKDVDDELGGLVHHLEQSEIECQEGVDVYLIQKANLAERNTVIDTLTAQVEEQKKVMGELREDICSEKDLLNKTYLEVASAGFGKRLKYLLTGNL